MTAPTARQLALLRAINEMTLRLGRAPMTSEVAAALGAERRCVRQRMRTAADAGFVTQSAVDQPQHPRSVRLTAEAKVALNLPIVVYAAFPVPPRTLGSDAVQRAAMRSALDQAADMCERLRQIGLAAVHPFSSLDTTSALGCATGAQIAPACDGVVILRDRTLLGRADVHSARVARVRVAVVASPSQLSQVDRDTLWKPPMLEPELEDIHSRPR